MKKGINKYLGAFVMGTALMAVPSCTDTWNEHYQTEDEYTATETLWELLESRDDLSNFRAIAEKAKFYRDEHHPAFTVEGGDTVYYYFKDVLSANTPVTLWVPRNDAMTQEEWDKYAAMVVTDGYNLQQQLIGNHMALYRKTMAKSGTETFKLINSKFAKLDYAEKMFQKSKVAESDIPARNGLLHVLESQNPFFYNLYEYIKFSGDVTIFRDYMVERDTTEFKENESIEGLPDENGNPTYVDSVYFQDNMMFNNKKYNPTGEDANDAWMNPLKMFNAKINVEDSSYVMVVPTDLAWINTTKKLEKYYNYGEGVYPRMGKVKNKTTKDATRDIMGARKTFNNVYDPDGTRTYETVDSLQAVNIEMDMLYPLVFNINLQPQHNNTPWTKETFMNGGYETCEYLLTTAGDTIRDIYVENDKAKTKILVWSKNELFGKGTVKEMSNGYAIVSDTWNYPRAYWMRDIDVEAEGMFCVYDKGTSTVTTPYDLSNTTTKDWIDEYGRCSEQKYLNVSVRTTNSTPEISFILNDCKQGEADVMSAKYDVKIILVPMWYNTSNTALPDSTYLRPDKKNPTPKSRLICTLYGWNGTSKEEGDLSFQKQTELGKATIDYLGEKVDTITIMEDVEFPLSYKNLEDAYPILHIKSATLKNADTKLGFQRNFNIDRIVLVAKEEVE